MADKVRRTPLVVVLTVSTTCWFVASGAAQDGLEVVAVRPNFRGVGASEGSHDDGIGETDDLVAVVEQMRGRFGALPLALAGFSFGGYVQTRVAQRVQPERMVLVIAGPRPLPLSAKLPGS